MPRATGRGGGGGNSRKEGYLGGADTAWGGRLGEAYAGDQVILGEDVFAAVAGIDGRT